VLVIPLKAVPSQQVTASLDGQSTTISIYQLGLAPATALYMDVAADSVAIANCRQCRAYSGSPTEAPPFMLLDSRYWGFAGDFMFLDTLGDEDPQYAGLGTRWLLLYFAPADLAAIGDPTQQAAA
jgi:hypothetical protein